MNIDVNKNGFKMVLEAISVIQFNYIFRFWTPKNWSELFEELLPIHQ